MHKSWLRLVQILTTRQSNHHCNGTVDPSGPNETEGKPKERNETDIWESSDICQPNWNGSCEENADNKTDIYPLRNGPLLQPKEWPNLAFEFSFLTWDHWVSNAVSQESSFNRVKGHRTHTHDDEDTFSHFCSLQSVPSVVSGWTLEGHGYFREAPLVPLLYQHKCHFCTNTSVTSVPTLVSLLYQH